MRILHLITSGTTEACHTTLAFVADLLQQSSTHDVSVYVVGGKNAVRTASIVGIYNAEWIRGPLGKAWSSVHQLAGQIASNKTPFDVIHAWSVESMMLAALACPKTPCVASLLHPIQIPTPIRWCPRRFLPRRCHVIAGQPSIADQAKWLRLSTDSISIQRPTVSLHRLTKLQRSELRERWGVTNDELVACVIGDPIEAANAFKGYWTIALASETGRPIKLLSSNRSAGLDRGKRILLASEREHMLLLDDALDTPWTSLAACDVAMCLGNSPTNPAQGNTSGSLVAADGGLSLRWAMAAGLPIVGEPTPAFSTVIQHEKTGLVAKSCRPRDIAVEVCRIADDRALAGRLARSARMFANFGGNARTYSEHCNRVYANMVQTAAIA